MNRTLKYHWIGIIGIALGFSNGAAQAAVNEVDLEFYGHLHLSTDYLYDGNEGGLNVASNASRLGIRAAHDIDHGLSIFAQIEKQVNLAEGSGTFSARNTLVGVRGRAGTLRIGYMTSPTMAMLTAVEEFRDRVGDGRNMLRRGSMNLDRRYRSALNYQTPTINGLTWTMHYGTNEAGGATVDNEQDVFGTSLAYKVGNWTFTGGYQHDDRDLERTIKGARFSVIRQGEGWRLAALLQQVDGLAEGDMTGWLVSGRYRYRDDIWLRAQIGARDYDTAKSDSMMLTFGVDRVLTPRFTWYTMATLTQNADAAVASVTEGGYGKNLVISAGDDPFAVSSGFIFKF